MLYADILSGTHDWPELTFGRIAHENEKRWEAQNQKTKAKMDTLVSLSNQRLDLGQAIDFMREATDANIVVNWAALELVGIDQDSLATVSLKGVPAWQLLGVILDQVSSDTFDDDKAGFTIDQGLVKVSTLRDLHSNTETRVYDVRPLLYQTERLQASLYREHERAEELIELLNKDTWLDPGLIGVKDLELDTEECVSVEERIDTLISLIQTVVADPDEWVEETHTIVELNGNLIINTTADDHEEIASLLLAIQVRQAEHFKFRARAIEVFLLLQDAEALRLNQQYKPALEKIEQALRVDPDSNEAKALKEIINATVSR